MISVLSTIVTFFAPPKTAPAPPTPITTPQPEPDTFDKIEGILDCIEYITFEGWNRGYRSISAVRSTPQHDVFEVAFEPSRISLDTVTDVLAADDFKVTDVREELNSYGYSSMTVVSFTFTTD